MCKVFSLRLRFLSELGGCVVCSPILVGWVLAPGYAISNLFHPRVLSPVHPFSSGYLPGS